MRMYEDMKGRLTMFEIILLCCGGWLMVVILALCLFTVGKWADENSLEALEREEGFKDVPDDVADIF